MFVNFLNNLYNNKCFLWKIKTEIKIITKIIKKSIHFLTWLHYEKCEKKNFILINKLKLYNFHALRNDKLILLNFLKSKKWSKNLINTWKKSVT